MGTTQELRGQTVVVIGGSAGIGVETARRARAEGANVLLTGRHRERLQRVATELGALSTAAFDANDPAALERIIMNTETLSDHREPTRSSLWLRRKWLVRHQARLVSDLPGLLLHHLKGGHPRSRATISILQRSIRMIRRSHFRRRRP